MKFEVKNLAKIKEAEFDIKDLTIFVGKNSTNKTYAAHTVYMLNKILTRDESDILDEKPFELFMKYYKLHGKEDILTLKKIKKNEQFKKKNIDIIDSYPIYEEFRVVSIPLTKSIDLIINKMKNYIIKYFQDLLNKSFNTNNNIFQKLFIKSNITDEFISIVSSRKEKDDFLLLGKIFDVVYNSYENLKLNEKGFYFPASRTGFVLAFDEIVSGVLRNRFGGQPTSTKLTEPTIDFIFNFSNIKAGNFIDGLKPARSSSYYKNEQKSEPLKKIKHLLDFVEQRIIKGKILEEKSSHNYTKIFLETNNKKLDLHLSSSATVEMLPLVIFLKHFSKLEDKFLVIEEPEAHLHPQAQIEMARLLVMLVNAGAKVLITTHSDYILNEISNCIKLAEADSKNVKKYLNEYKLDKEIIISKDRVSAYLFKDVDESVEVKALEIDEYGISNDNFDDVLDELLDRTEEINKFIEPKFN